MKYTIKVDAKCPYCGKYNTIIIDPMKDHKMQVILCDIEIGGCDRYFVTEIAVKATAKSYAIDDSKSDE